MMKRQAKGQFTRRVPMLRRWTRPAFLLILFLCAALLPDRVEAWDPFKNKDTRNPSRGARSGQSLPPTSQFVIVSRGTDAALSQAIARYQQIVAAGGWRPIPAGPTLRFGDRDNRVILLRQRLKATGELDARVRDSSGYDREVADAVTRFQRRHGLTPSGKVNRFTFRALNVSADKRLHQLRLNQKRLRRLQTRLGNGPYILVNIPGYELQAVSNGQLQISSRVIVGKPATSTPEVSASVRAVNFLPYWHVPHSIAQRALIPAVKNNPNYLAKERIRVFASWGGAEIDPSQINWWSPQGKRFVFRQDPGPFNALGLIRLDMSNKYTVYMHDTPLKRLFRFHLRPYSAGCVRVEQIQPLAEWLLRREAGWGPAQVTQAMHSGQQQTVKLSRPVPVHFVYLTAWANEGGSAVFRMDIYDRDGSDFDGARSAQWNTGSRSIAP
jgi:murein L,D-transpeptidase YcbB/YkuD